MRFEPAYPPAGKKKLRRRDVISAARWPFLFAAYACPIINILLGGQAWSVVALWSLWFVWSMLFSTDLVEYNRIRQFIKLVFYSAVLLVLIDVLISPGWAKTVVPMVAFGGVALGGVFLFTDLEKQRKNMSPILLLTAASLAASIIGLIVWGADSPWAIIVLAAISFALLAVCLLVLGGGLFRDLKKYFHTN